MNATDTETLEEVSEGLFHFLVGHLKANPGRAQEIQKYTKWQERAEQEMERRMTRMLEAFSDETIQALAEGKVSLPEIAAKAERKVKSNG